MSLAGKCIEISPSGEEDNPVVAPVLRFATVGAPCR